MKVLQINSVCGIGSTGRIATDIHSLLIKNGYESYVAYGRDKNRYSEEAIKIGNKLSIYTHVAKTRLFDKHGFGSKLATKNFINRIKMINPDIIHLHNLHGYYINIEILFEFLRERKKPIVWTLHDCWSFTGHCTYFEYSGCKKWKTQCQQCVAKKNYPKCIIMDNSFNNYYRKMRTFADLNDITLVTPSRWLANLVNESYLKSYPLKIINNGVNLDTFKPVNSKFRDKYGIHNKFIILGVANVWDQRKGLSYFLELADKLGEDEIIVLVGLKGKQLKHIHEKIIVIKRTYNLEELVDIYSGSNVYVNPTLEDNFPTTNIEALACGIPVVTFDTGGAAESVKGNTGVVLKEKNTSEIYHSIKLIKKMSNDNYLDNCRKRAKDYYNKMDKYEEYMNLYLSLLKN